MENKIIFLDIDGVVCTLRSHFAFGDGLLMECWDITACHMIKNICKKFDLKIVISSVWKADPKLKYYLSIFGLIEFLHKDYCTPNTGKIRGDQIEEWLKKHPEVEDYIIIDDDQDFLEKQKNHFSHIKNPYDGFSTENYRWITRYFNPS